MFWASGNRAVFGSYLVQCGSVIHGKARNTKVIANDILFDGISQRIYEWQISFMGNKDIPPALCVTAVDDDGIVQAIKHTNFNVRGVQFHPESVMTPVGKDIIQNWLYKC